jgi:hypothetical protein
LKISDLADDAELELNVDDENTDIGLEVAVDVVLVFDGVALVEIDDEATCIVLGLVEIVDVDVVLVVDGVDVEMGLDIIVLALVLSISSLKSKSVSMKLDSSLKSGLGDKDLSDIEGVVLALVLDNGLSDVLRAGVTEALG